MKGRIDVKRILVKFATFFVLVGILFASLELWSNVAKGNGFKTWIQPFGMQFNYLEGALLVTVIVVLPIVVKAFRLYKVELEQRMLKEMREQLEIKRRNNQKKQ